MSLSVYSIVLNTTDLPRALRFYFDLLGAVPRDTEHGLDHFVAEGWVTLLLPGGTGRIALQSGAMTPVAKDQPIHLDLVAEDRAAEVERALSVGAQPVPDWPYPADADYTVLRDPDGHLFCIVDA